MDFSSKYQCLLTKCLLHDIFSVNYGDDQNKWFHVGVGSYISEIVKEDEVRDVVVTC